MNLENKSLDGGAPEVYNEALIKARKICGCLIIPLILAVTIVFVVFNVGFLIMGVMVFLNGLPLLSLFYEKYIYFFEIKDAQINLYVLNSLGKKEEKKIHEKDIKNITFRKTILYKNHKIQIQTQHETLNYVVFGDLESKELISILEALKK